MNNRIYLINFIVICILIASGSTSIERGFLALILLTLINILIILAKMSEKNFKNEKPKN